MAITIFYNFTERIKSVLFGLTIGDAPGLMPIEKIPAKWIKQLARMEDIENLAERLGRKLYNR